MSQVRRLRGLNPKEDSVMGWLKTLKEARGDDTPAEANKPWLSKLKEQAEAMAEQSDDPWAPILANLKGHVVRGIERISTKDVFEKLGIPARAQSSDIRRRLARRMVTPISTESGRL